MSCSSTVYVITFLVTLAGPCNGAFQMVRKERAVLEAELEEISGEGEGGRTLPSQSAALMAEADASSEVVFREFMHKSVGKVPPGGHAIVISLMKEPERAAFVHKSLTPLGVDLVDMQAIDDKTATREEIHSACGFEKYPGALTDASRARAASHKKALMLAADRKEDWTLILEDDVAPLPIPHEEWLAGFDSAWKRLKNRDPAVVRLGWCQFNGGTPEVETLKDGFQIVHRILAGYHDHEAPQGINNGLCSTAYIVSKKYVQQMIKAFPGCHEPLDLFYAHELFNKKPFSNKVWSITHKNSTALFKGWRDFEQHGLIAQRPTSIASEKQVVMTESKVLDAKHSQTQKKTMIGSKTVDAKYSQAQKKSITGSKTVDAKHSQTQKNSMTERKAVDASYESKAKDSKLSQRQKKSKHI